MAAVLHRVATPSTLNAATYASDAFTPAAGELLVVFVTASGTVAAGTMTDSQALGFTKINSALWGASTATLYLFVADALAAASSMTVTFNCTGDNATGSVILGAGVSGMTKLGALAVRQSAKEENAADADRTVDFAIACLTENPTLVAMANGFNPAAATEPTGWTELADTGYGTPNTGAEYASRDAGFTGTTVTWGSNLGGNNGKLVVELDASSDAFVPRNPAINHQNPAFV